MSKQNKNFPGKQKLDIEAAKYSDSVFCHFEYQRLNGASPQFGSHFFPAMVAVCTDIKQRCFKEGSSGKPVLTEYKSTGMLAVMERNFGRIKKYEDLRTKSLEQQFHIGQCAEQHVANKLLADKKMKPLRLNIKTDIFFSKAIRPATGEVFPYCSNCTTLFDL